jgi:hypothetical protein
MIAPARLLALALCLPPAASAFARDGPADGDADDVHRDHTIVGVKGVATTEQASAHGRTLTLSGYGVAAMAERTLLDDRLSLELDVVFTSPGGERTVSTEPMAKWPWHAARHLEPYAAAGPLLVHVEDGHGAHYWLGGGQLVLGALIWLAEAAGLDVDIALGAARGPDMQMLEATLAIGPVLRE